MSAKADNIVLNDAFTEDPLNIELDNSNDQQSLESYDDEEEDCYEDDSDDFNADDLEIENKPVPIKDLTKYEIPVAEIAYSIQKSFKYECMYCIHVCEEFNSLTEHIADDHVPYKYLPARFFRRQNAGEIKCGKILMSEVCYFVHECFLCQEQYSDANKFCSHILESHLGDCGVLKLNYKERNTGEQNVGNCNGFELKPLHETPVLPDEDEEDKPCKCRYCNKGFKRDSDRKRHERIHTGEKPYKCEVCNKAFTQSGTLKGHKRTHLFQKFKN